MATIKEVVEKLNNQIDKYFGNPIREIAIEDEIKDIQEWENIENRDIALRETKTFTEFNKKLLQPITQQVIKADNLKDMYYFAKNVKYADKGMIFDAILKSKNFDIKVVLQYINEFKYWDDKHLGTTLCRYIVNDNIDVRKLSTEELISIFDNIKNFDIDELDACMSIIVLISKLTTKDTIEHVLKNLKSLDLSESLILNDANFTSLYIEHLSNQGEYIDFEDIIKIHTSYGREKVEDMELVKSIILGAIKCGEDPDYVVGYAYDCGLEANEVFDLFIDIGNVKPLMYNIFDIGDIRGYLLNDEHLKKFKDLLIEQCSTGEIHDFIYLMNYNHNDLKSVDLKKLNQVINTKVASGDISILETIDYDKEAALQILDIKGLIKALTKAQEALSNDKSSDNKDEIANITEYIEFFEQKLNNTTEQGLKQ